MHEIERTLAGLGLAWDEVWRLTADRRAGSLVVVMMDGRKFSAELIETGFFPERSPLRQNPVSKPKLELIETEFSEKNSVSRPKRVKAVKGVE